MIEVENIAKHFKKVKAVDGVSFKVQDGEVVGLLGANGAAQALEQVRQHVVEMLEQEGLLDEVLAMGLEFQVGSKVRDRLSGGQRQKIALARAFLKNPHILIMDEATASLDNASQARIQQLLETEFRGRCTLVAVVHRLDTVAAYDQIAVMKAGRIVEMGKYQELMAGKGIFHGLVQGTRAPM